MAGASPFHKAHAGAELPFQFGLLFRIYVLFRKSRDRRRRLKSDSWTVRQGSNRTSAPPEDTSHGPGHANGNLAQRSKPLPFVGNGPALVRWGSGWFFFFFLLDLAILKLPRWCNHWKSCTVSSFDHGKIRQVRNGLAVGRAIASDPRFTVTKQLFTVSWLQGWINSHRRAMEKNCQWRSDRSV